MANELNRTALRSRVRQELSRVELPAQQQVEVIEEVTQLLEDAADSAGIDLSDEIAREAWLRSEIPSWQALVDTLGGTRRTLLPKSGATPPIAAAAHHPSRLSSGLSNMISGLEKDFRQAIRLISKAPAFSVIAILTLGLGIGLNTAIFSIVNYALLDPLAVEDQDSLVRIYTNEPGSFLPEEPSSYPDFLDLRDNSKTLSDLAVHAMTMVALEQDDGNPTIAPGEMVSGNYFELLGIEPHLGRLLTSSDDDVASPQQVVVLSHATWVTRFGANQEIVGKDVRINNHPLTVIGIAPESFQGLWPTIVPELWFPVTLTTSIGATGTINASTGNGDRLVERNSRWLWMIGRRSHGLEAAREEIATLATGLSEQYPDSNEERGFIVLPSSAVRIMPVVDGPLKAGSLVLMLIVSLVLFIACANVANMQMARALARRKEIATRLALGGSRFRIIRQLTVESLLLALMGGGLGVLLAVASNKIVQSIQMPSIVPLEFSPTLDLRVLAFAFGLATLTALLFGLVPALQATKTDLAVVMKENDARLGSGRKLRLQNALVVLQVSLSLALLICAGLSVRSMLNTHRMDLGFQPDGIVTATLDPELQGIDNVRSEQIYDDLTAELESLPGVESVATSTMVPLSLMINEWDVVPQGKEHLEQEDWYSVDTSWVTGSYFETMKVPLLDGRTFNQADWVDTAARRARQAEAEAARSALPDGEATAEDEPPPLRIAIVNQTLAQRFWPGESAIGKRLTANGESWYEVVGVVADGKYRWLGEEPRPFLFQSLEQTDASMRFVVTRFRGDAEAAIPSVRRALSAAAPGIAVTNLGSIHEVIGPSMILPMLGARIFGIFGVLGLFLAAIGLYAVLSYIVNQRTHEIGLRIALGADRSSILRLVLRRGIGLIAVGVTTGLVLAFFLSRTLSAILHGVSATDPLTFIFVTLALIVVALYACWLPARRASGVDPLISLRHD